MERIVIRGGRIVTTEGVRDADVAIAEGRIERIGRDLDWQGDRDIDASGMLVLPGIIDMHTHPVYLDDLATLPVTGAHGGVTTVVHYAYAKPGQGLMDTLHRFREEGEASILDFGLHGGLFDPANQSHEIPEAFEFGVTSQKMFMAYAKLGWMTDDYQLMRTLDILGRVGGMGMVHAENGLASDYLEDKTNEAGEDPLEEVWTGHPRLLELRDGLPSRLEGICSRCLMRQRCLGSCLAQNYYRTGRYWAPYWFCEEADRIGRFPRTRTTAIAGAGDREAE